MKTYEATEQAYRNGYEKGKQDAMKWISVKDRLPEKCGRFLVYGSRGGIYTAEFRKFGDLGGEYPHWHKLNSKNHRCDPTHWMPLPEPPKGE